MKIKNSARYYLMAGIAFTPIYGGLNYWTSQQTERLRLYLSWELDIPFVPGFIYGYLSIILLFLLPLFSLNLRQIRALCVAFIAATLMAGLFYVVLPAELAHERPAELPAPQPLFGILYALALPHNLFPSLHITYSTLILLTAVTRIASTVFAIFATCWMLLIVLSVVLIRQHQLIDIIGGWVLGWIAFQFIYQSLLVRDAQLP